MRFLFLFSSIKCFFFHVAPLKFVEQRVIIVIMYDWWSTWKTKMRKTYLNEFERYMDSRNSIKSLIAMFKINVIVGDAFAENSWKVNWKCMKVQKQDEIRTSNASIAAMAWTAKFPKWMFKISFNIIFLFESDLMWMVIVRDSFMTCTFS